MARRAASVWDELGVVRADEDGFLRRRVASGEGWTLDAAMEKPSDLEALWLDLPTSVLAKGLEVVESGGFKLLLKTISPGRSGRTRVVLQNVSNDYQDLFRSFSGNIIDRLQSIATSSEAISGFMDQVGRWQSFLSKFGKGGLSEEAQQGLYGELTFLIRMCISVPANQAVGWWTGPSGTAQDYECGSLAVEVKTNRRARRVARISSVDQLWVPENVDLYLYYLELDVRQGNDMTLVDKIREARECVRQSGKGNIADFEERLQTAGYLDAQEKNYSGTSYSVRREIVFHVMEGFPRLVRSAIPDGLSAVKYDVELSRCDTFRTSIETLDIRLREQAR